MDTECEEKHSWVIILEETHFLPKVGHNVHVIRNHPRVRKGLRVEACELLPLTVTIYILVRDLNNDTGGGSVSDSCAQVGENTCSLVLRILHAGLRHARRKRRPSSALL